MKSGIVMRMVLAIVLLFGCVNATWADSGSDKASMEMIRQLHEAVKQMDSEKVAALLKQGVPADSRLVEGGPTPLYEAVCLSDPGIVKLLLNAGADPVARCTCLRDKYGCLVIFKPGRTPIERSMNCSPLKPAVIRMLMEHERFNCTLTEPSNWEIYNYDNDKSLSKKGSSDKSMSFLKRCLTPPDGVLGRPTEPEPLEEIAILAMEKCCPICPSENAGDNLLEGAIECRFERAALKLMELGILDCLAPEEKEASFRWAVRREMFGVLDVLLEKKQKPNWFSVLDQACLCRELIRKAKWDSLTYLLDQGIDPTGKCKPGDEELGPIVLLIDQFPSMKTDVTPQMPGFPSRTVRQRDLREFQRICRRLIDAGCDVNGISGKWMDYPLLHVIQATNLEADRRIQIMRALVENGASVKGPAGSYSPLASAAERGMEAVVRFLLENGFPLDKQIRDTKYDLRDPVQLLKQHNMAHLIPK